METNEGDPMDVNGEFIKPENEEEMIDAPEQAISEFENQTQPAQSSPPSLPPAVISNRIRQLKKAASVNQLNLHNLLHYRCLLPS
jgi:hypothetical protein